MLAPFTYINLNTWIFERKSWVQTKCNLWLDYIFFAKIHEGVDRKLTRAKVNDFEGLVGWDLLEILGIFRHIKCINKQWSLRVKSRIEMSWNSIIIKTLFPSFIANVFVSLGKVSLQHLVHTSLARTTRRRRNYNDEDANE